MLHTWSLRPNTIATTTTNAMAAGRLRGATRISSGKRLLTSKAVWTQGWPAFLRSVPAAGAAASGPLSFVVGITGNVAVHRVQLDGFDWHGGSLQLQLVEVLGPLAAFFQQPLDRAGIDLTDIRRGRHRQAISKALGDPDQGGRGQLAVLQQRALAFAEPPVADVTVMEGVIHIRAQQKGRAPPARPERD
jgi:hypothetical protein